MDEEWKRIWTIALIPGILLWFGVVFFVQPSLYGSFNFPITNKVFEVIAFINNISIIFLVAGLIYVRKVAVQDKEVKE